MVIDNTSNELSGNIEKSTAAFLQAFLTMRRKQQKNEPIINDDQTVLRKTAEALLKQAQASHVEPTPMYFILLKYAPDAFTADEKQELEKKQDPIIVRRIKDKISLVQGKLTDFFISTGSGFSQNNTVFTIPSEGSELADTPVLFELNRIQTDYEYGQVNKVSTFKSSVQFQKSLAGFDVSLKKELPAYKLN